MSKCKIMLHQRQLIRAIAPKSKCHKFFLWSGKHSRFCLFKFQILLAGNVYINISWQIYPAEAGEILCSKICMVALFSHYLMESILQLPNSDLACLKPLKRLSSPSENRSFCIELHIKAPNSYVVCWHTDMLWVGPIIILKIKGTSWTDCGWKGIISQFIRITRSNVHYVCMLKIEKRKRNPYSGSYRSFLGRKRS